MSRYVTRPRAGKPLYIETPLWEDHRDVGLPCLTVDDAKEVDTGLVSEAGDPIYRLVPPIGFGRDEEW